MNKAAMAIAILELQLSEWEPIVVQNGFAIKDRVSGEIISHGKSLKEAIIKARDKEMELLKSMTPRTSRKKK